MYVIYYYDVPLCTVRAGNRADAVRQMGIMYGGQVGVRLVEVA